MSDVTQLGKYQPYPEYKNSGVEWLGKIPFNWTATKVKRFASFTTGWTPPTGNELFFGGEHLWANISDIGEKFLSSTSKTITDAGIRATKIKKSPKGSLLFSFKLSIGQVSIVSEDMYTNEAIATFLPSESLNVPYMYWAAPLFIPRNAEENIYGAKLLNQERISNADFVLPSTDEQRTIAAFLDYETARIDQLIAKQQQLIELLKEKRQAVISHAVTKGLNPNAPMKESGVEWLGQVPEHWEAVRVKQVSTFITSGPRGWSDFIVDDGDEIFLQSGDLNNELGIDFGKAKKVLPPKNAEGVRTKLNNGDVLVCITGANTGRVAVANNIQNGVYINQHLSLIRPKITKVESCFLGLCLSSSVGRSFFDVAQYGLKEGLSLSNISEAPLALPPKNEQSLIISYIENISHHFSLLSNSAYKQVELLKERRTALISAAVTGKIDLRGWQAPKSEVAA